MSVKQSFSSSSYSTSSSGASLCTNPMKSSSSSDSTSCQSLLQSSRDIARKMATSRCANQENDSAGRSFLSVRKNDSLMRSRANMVERSITQGSQLRLLQSEIDVIFLEPCYGTMYFLIFVLLDIAGEHSSKECCTSPPDIDVGNNDNPDFQGSAYSRSSSSFLIEDILFQRPKVKFENSSWH